ncbi:MAG: carboxypeptidase-like regulatory domain-containing protein [Prevotellaceae bacterium]|nr:carboxypeptidase-like regulatory domain-containing protein [Prevotellaceae bacterium]
MKTSKFLRAFALVALLGSTATMISSCKEDETPSEDSKVGTVSGTVTDVDSNEPVEGVTVAVSGVEGTVATGSDGKYTVANVSIEAHTVSFSKTGWLPTSVTVAASKFNADKVATVNVTLQNASAKIQGTVTDALNNSAPLADVAVSIGVAGSDTTGADGTYAIENLIVEAYTATFSKTGYPAITRTIAAADFVDGVATVDVEMGSPELLPGKTYFDLLEADKWYYNEYRGGGDADAYPHWDWACNYMCALSFEGAWAEQWEGTTLQIRNDEAAGHRNNPADLEVFDSYVYGAKKITADNKILSLRVRTHNADEAAPAHFGVQVVDLSAATPEAKKVGENRTYGSEVYTDYEFDLSEYVDKEVVIAVGIYRAATGDYWKQLVLRAIRFASAKVEGTSWLPGTEVVEGWKLTQEMVRSTMTNANKKFTGISDGSANRNVSMTEGYPVVYRSWRATHHIGYEWSFVPLHKDPEVTPSEGYLIKTRGSEASVNTVEPEAYYYSKFAIAAGNNQLTLKTRNFGSNYTFFKLTAITEAGAVTHIAPVSNTATEASAAENGCWKFKHGSGGRDNPEEYASFVYDLSQFNGSNVVLAFGVYKGEANGNESKLVFYSIELN